MKQQFKHKEAFCLMYYENKDTKAGFMVWNSRDGVTPFIVFESGVEYQHQHWGMDKIPNPDYIKKAIWVQGQRIFRNTSSEEAREFAVKRIAAFKGTPYELQEGTEKYNAMIETLSADFSSPGQPTMVTLKGDEPMPDVIEILTLPFMRHG